MHVAAAEDETQKRTYIVHMDNSSKPAAFDEHFNWYESSLKAVSESANMFYTCNHAIHGFATRSSKKEAELLKRQPGVLSVIVVNMKFLRLEKLRKKPERILVEEKNLYYYLNCFSFA
ncbi:Peptidase S8, subtilisin-related [Parasponia andersonii]|uniref:Peptidase S8, subtilisin-related n=1 Tax=Parasponia andersonii TaxID=3476 RepID=A0A2P5BZM7_PARAD|nr:Peptidase S8, subtilisin-related [Parasponia andersonii]